MTTFVTGFFNLPAIEENTVRRPTSTYFRVSEELLIHDINLVYYGDKEMAEYIKKRRDELGFTSKTQIHILDISELSYYEYKDEIQRIINSKGIYGATDSKRYTVGFLICIISKVFMLHESAKLNPFNTPNFCWVDFGLFHFKESYPCHFNNVNMASFTQIDSYWKDNLIKISAINPFNFTNIDATVYN